MDKGSTAYLNPISKRKLGFVSSIAISSIGQFPEPSSCKGQNN